MNKKEMIGTLGSIALLVGLFLPAFSIPIMGGVSFFSFYGIFAAGIGFVGIAALVIFISSQADKAFIPSAIATLLVGASLVDLCGRLISLADAASATANNYFAQMMMGGLSNSIQVGPAYAALVVGAALMIYASITPDVVTTIHAFAVMSLRWVFGIFVVVMIVYGGFSLYHRYQEYQKLQAVKTGIAFAHQIADDIEEYYKKEKTFPSSLDDLPPINAKDRMPRDAYKGLSFNPYKRTVELPLATQTDAHGRKIPLYVVLRPVNSWQGGLSWGCMIDKRIIATTVAGCIPVENPQ